jgi:hypothetical protein
LPAWQRQRFGTCRPVPLKHSGTLHTNQGCSRTPSVFVVVIVVGCVPASIVDVVDVIAVRNSHMTASLPVSVVVRLMCRVAAASFAFVKVIAMPSVKMTVVHIVDVITVRDRDMPAPVTMRMIMTGMRLVSYSVHFCLLATQFNCARE